MNDICTSEETLSITFDSEEVELESIQRQIKRFKAFKKLPVKGLFDFYIIKKAEFAKIKELYSVIGDLNNFCILQKNYKRKEYIRLVFVKTDHVEYNEIKEAIISRVMSVGYELSNQNKDMTEWYILNGHHPCNLNTFPEC